MLSGSDTGRSIVVAVGDQVEVALRVVGPYYYGSPSVSKEHGGNLRAHSAIHAAVENQLAEGLDAAVRAMTRLVAQGLDRNEWERDSLLMGENGADGITWVLTRPVRQDRCDRPGRPLSEHTCTRICAAQSTVPSTTTATSACTAWRRASGTSLPHVSSGPQPKGSSLNKCCRVAGRGVSCEGWQTSRRSASGSSCWKAC
jgi:hypothetical protein